MQTQSISNVESWTHSLLLHRLEILKTISFTEITPIRLATHRLCSWFSIKKEECWELLRYLESEGLIEIIPFHGIKIN